LKYEEATLGTDMINVPSASAMDQEKRNNWHNINVVKLKHMAVL
jgi:hypothetical protein